MDPPHDPPDVNAFPWPFDPAFSFTSTYNLAPDATFQPQHQPVAQGTMNPQLMNQQYGWAQDFQGMWAQGSGGFGSWNAGMGGLPQMMQEPAPSVLQQRTSFAPVVNALSTAGTGMGKPPPQDVVFGPRAWVSLKTYENGEARIQRRVIRYGLEIVQQPIQGKTFTEKDRRAIVHPPVVRLWLVESSPVNPEYAASFGEAPLNDELAWSDSVLDVSAIDTSGYTCIVDALLAPDEGSTSSAPEESTDDLNPLLPSGYKLCNVVPISSPTPPTTTEPRTLASLMASPDTISPVAERRISTISRTEQGPGSRRPSRRTSGKVGVDASESATREPSESSGDISSKTLPRRTDSIVSSALAGPESSPHTSSAPSKSSSSGSTPQDPALMWKRNLMGNWAVGCRKMYGMGTPDDLGIWFVFTDVSIQQPGRYALRFRCFNLHDAQMTTSDTPPVLPPPPPDASNLEEQGGTYAERRETDAKSMEMDSEQSHGFRPKEEDVTPPSRASIATTLVEGTPATPVEKVKTEARPLCEVQSADFTVYGIKGMPPWPHTSEMTSYFIR